MFSSSSNETIKKVGVAAETGSKPLSFFKGRSSLQAIPIPLFSLPPLVMTPGKRVRFNAIR